MLRIKIHVSTTDNDIPIIFVDLYDEDDNVAFTAAARPLKEGAFLITKRLGFEYSQSTFGRSPNLDINKYFSKDDIDSPDLYKILMGQFALAIADMMYIMNDLLGISIESPLLDMSVRNNKNHELSKFIEHSAEYLLQ